MEFCRVLLQVYVTDCVSRAFEEAAQSLGLPPIRLHDTKHSHATLALVAGVPVKVVQVGHSTPAITMAVDQHATPGMDHDAADTVAALSA